MCGYIEAIKRLLNDIENEKDFNKQLKLIDDLSELSCDFYNDMLDKKHG